MPITAPMQGRDLLTGRTIQIPADRRYTYEVINADTAIAHVRVFDSAGLELQMHFEVPAVTVGKAEISAPTVQDAVKPQPVVQANPNTNTNTDAKPEVAAVDPAPIPAEKPVNAPVTTEPLPFVPMSVQVSRDMDKAAGRPAGTPLMRPREAKPTDKEELKSDITEGLKATRGSIAKKDPCCNIVDAEDEPEKATVKPVAQNPAKKDNPVRPQFELDSEELRARMYPEKYPPASAVTAQPVAKPDSKPVPNPVSNPVAKPVAKMDTKKPGRAPAIEPIPFVAQTVVPGAKPEPSATILTAVPTRRPNRIVAGAARGDGGSRTNGEGAGNASSPSDRRGGSSDTDEYKSETPADQSVCGILNKALKQKGPRGEKVPDAPIRQALYYYAKNKNSDKLKSSYVGVADYSQSSTKNRMFLIDMRTGDVTFEKVSHGSGRGNSGDPDHDGMLDGCGTSGSDRTRAGFFKAGDTYYSDHGRNRGWPLISRTPARNGLRLYGLTKGVNTSVFDDGYVMHEAPYNAGGTAIMGRSDGCPAFVPGHGAPVMARLKLGALHYNYAPVCRAQQSIALRQVEGWENFCR